MTRVTRHQRHKKKLIYGFRSTSSLLFKKASQQEKHAFQNAFRDRRLRKRFYRTLWMNRMNAHFRQFGFNYSQSKHKQGKMNRKVISQLSLYDFTILC